MQKINVQAQVLLKGREHKANDVLFPVDVDKNCTKNAHNFISFKALMKVLYCMNYHLKTIYFNAFERI